VAARRRGTRAGTGCEQLARRRTSLLRGMHHMIRLDSGPRCSGGEIYWLIRRVIAGHQPNPTTGARAPTRAPALSLAAAPTDHELSLDDILQQLRNEIASD